MKRLRLAFSYVFRSLHIATISTLFVIAFLISRFSDPESGPSLLRSYFEKCGGAFVKFGQILAMRYDLLPLPYCDELLKLLDRLPPAPTEEILRTIESELGLSLTDCFKDFDQKPIASASVSHVYQATLTDGTEVVVKVRRPGITWRYRVDFLNAKLFAYLMDLSGFFGFLDMRGLTNELIRLAEDELDFYREARNAQAIHEAMQQDDIDHYAPRVYLSLSSTSVITMEKLSGVWLTDVIEALNSKNVAQLLVWQQQGISLTRTARLLLRSTLVQCFTHRLYHADPHPANLLIQEGGTLAYVDFGMVGWLDERAWSQQFKLREFIANEMLHGAYETLLDILQPIPDRDLTRFERQIKNLMRDYLSASKDPNATLTEKSSGYFFMRMCDVIRRENLSMPSSVMRLYRTMGIADMVMLRLYPSIDWLPELREFISEETSRQIHLLLSRRQIQTAFSSILMNFLNLPQLTGDILDWAQNRLPELGRTYTRQISIIEQLGIVMLKSVKTIGFSVTVFVLIAHFGVPHIFSSELLKDFNEKIGPWWWLVAIISLILAGMTRRLIKRLRVA